MGTGRKTPDTSKTSAPGYADVLNILSVTAEELRAIIGWKSAILLERGPVDPKFQVEGVVPHQPFFFSEN